MQLLDKCENFIAPQALIEHLDKITLFLCILEHRGAGKIVPYYAAPKDHFGKHKEVILSLCGGNHFRKRCENISWWTIFRLIYIL